MVAIDGSPNELLHSAQEVGYCCQYGDVVHHVRIENQGRDALSYISVLKSYNIP